MNQNWKREICREMQKPYLGGGCSSTECKTLSGFFQNVKIKVCVQIMFSIIILVVYVFKKM